MSVVSVLACSVAATPCPVESQTWVALSDTVDWTALGVTAADILYVFSWGSGSVLALWAIGYAVGAACSAIGKA